MSTLHSPDVALPASALATWRHNLAALLDAHEQAGGNLYGTQGAPQTLLPPPQQPVLSLQETPTLALPEALAISDRVSLEWTLDTASAPWLLDHIVEGKPVLPMAFALETMAQFAARLSPDQAVAEVCELQVLNGIALDTSLQGRALLLRGQRLPDARGWSVEIADARRGNSCYRAQVLMQAQLPPAPAPMATDGPACSGEALAAAQVYDDVLFHGPRFQCIRHISALDASGADAQVHASEPAAMLDDATARPWLFDPGLLDLPPQLAFVWALRQQGMGALPSRLGRLQRFDAPAGNHALQLRWRLKPAPHASALRYDAEFLDDTGRVCLRISDGESTMSPALARLAPMHRRSTA